MFLSPAFPRCCHFPNYASLFKLHFPSLAYRVLVSFDIYVGFSALSPSYLEYQCFRVAGSRPGLFILTNLKWSISLALTLSPALGSSLTCLPQQNVIKALAALAGASGPVPQNFIVIHNSRPAWPRMFKFTPKMHNVQARPIRLYYNITNLDGQNHSVVLAYRLIKYCTVSLNLLHRNTFSFALLIRLHLNIRLFSVKAKGHIKMINLQC